jgi:hypothetical protein
MAVVLVKLLAQASKLGIVFNGKALGIFILLVQNFSWEITSVCIFERFYK